MFLVDRRGTITIFHRQEEAFCICYSEIRITKELASFLIKKLRMIDDQTKQNMLLSEKY